EGGGGSVGECEGGTADLGRVVGPSKSGGPLRPPPEGVKLPTTGGPARAHGPPPPAVEAAASAAGLASPASAALFPAGPPSAIFSTADGAAVATSETGILVPVRTPEQEPEATGQIQTSRHRSERAGATTTASAPASAAPPLNLDLAMPGPAQ